MTRLSMVLLCLFSLACTKDKPKVGDPCENGRRACVDGQTGLYCAGGAYQLDKCNGPRGCYEEKGLAGCDITGNNEGDLCPKALDGFSVCRVDRKSRATCKGGQYVVEPCRGPNGCTTEQVGMATCDRGNPEIGEPCDSDSRRAFCSGDGKSALNCHAGKFKLAQRCPGPSGCKDAGGGIVVCDPMGTFKHGEPCWFLEQACGPDNKTLLRCKIGNFFTESDCPGEGRCSDGVCDIGLATAKEGCPSLGKRACSMDKKAIVECKAGAQPSDGNTWQVTKTCKSCEPKDGVLDCK